MADHSPEPWHVSLGFDHHEIVDANGKMLATSQNKYVLERIVACVNACKGVPTEELHPGSLNCFITRRRAAYAKMKKLGAFKLVPLCEPEEKSNG